DEKVREAINEELRCQRTRMHQERYFLNKLNIVVDLETSVKEWREVAEELGVQHHMRS
ncbi:hypothetical protein L917_10776, partial [Phytophthora nicotianae]